MYSCKSKYDYLHLDENTIIPNPQKFKLTFYELVFQYILNKENILLDRFSCTNKIIPSKTKTSRAILKTKFNVDFSYCLETSLAAMKTKDGNIIPFTINQYKKIGKDFCISLNKLIDPKIFFSVLSTIRFSKNEKCSLYSKSKAKAIYLPNANNNSIMNISNNETLNSSKSNNNIKNKNNKNENNKNENNKINNYFHKSIGKITNTNINNKAINLSKKSSGISNLSSKDINKKRNFKKHKDKNSFEIKHS